MEDIARAVGIRKASLYAHFEGKERIFLAIFEDILEEYARTIDLLTAPSEEDALERLERVFLSFIDYCHDNRRMYFWGPVFLLPARISEGSHPAEDAGNPGCVSGEDQTFAGGGHGARGGPGISRLKAPRWPTTI